MAAKKTKASTKKTASKKATSKATKAVGSTAAASKPAAKKAVTKTTKSKVDGRVASKAAAKASEPKPAAAKAAAPKAAAPKAAAPKEKSAKPASRAASNSNETIGAESTKLGVGDVVPTFEALDQTGQVVSSGSLSGAPYVIYFYPKDDTPGCTTEACGFRDELAVFAERGVKVLGVSPDSSASHAKFAQKYGLGFTLLADTDKQLVGLFGVWKLKQNYGREYWGVERSTFVVDAEGKIRKQWRGVKVAGHVPAVLQAVSEL